MQFVFSTPVWGQAHLRLFLEIGLPSLLSPGNIPGMSTARASRYLIHTTADGEPWLRQSAAFNRLSELMPVDIRRISGQIGDAHRAMSDCHREAMQIADTSRIAAVFIPPDCVWSDGSLTRLEKIAGNGVSVVHMTGIRLNRDAIAPQLRAYLTPEGTVLAIPARKLVQLGLSNLHRIALGHFWNEHAGGVMPANLYWSGPQGGLLAHCFHLHPLMVRSQFPGESFRVTIDDDLALRACPDASRDYVVTDSDEILAFEMSGDERVVSADFVKGSPASAASWAEVGANTRHRQLVRHAVRIHQDDIDEAAWHQVQRRARQAVGEMLAILDMPTLLLALRHPRILAWRARHALSGRSGLAALPWLLILRALEMPALARYLAGSILAKVFPWRRGRQK